MIALTVVALALAGCGRTPDAGVATTTTAPPDETTVATSVAPPTINRVTTTIATTTTTTTSPPSTSTSTTVSESAVEPGVPRKPQGEPAIEFPTFLQLGDLVYAPDESDTDSAVSNGMTFEEVSGYRSYRVDYHFEGHSEGETIDRTTTATIDGHSAYLEMSSNDAGDYTIVSTPQGVWMRESEQWHRTEDRYEGLLVLMFIQPGYQTAEYSDTFDTLAFVDWDLIDSVWYARYEAGDAFLSVAADGDPIKGMHADVWLSPDGYIHSYDIVFADPATDAELLKSWRLSELGTAVIDGLDELP